MLLIRDSGSPPRWAQSDSDPVISNLKKGDLMISDIKERCGVRNNKVGKEHEDLTNVAPVIDWYKLLLHHLGHFNTTLLFQFQFGKPVPKQQYIIESRPAN